MTQLGLTGSPPIPFSASIGDKQQPKTRSTYPSASATPYFDGLGMGHERGLEALDASLFLFRNS